MGITSSLLAFWYFLLISDDLALLLCAFAIWRRNRVKRIRLFQLLSPMLAGVVLYSLVREMHTLILPHDLRQAVFAASIATPVASILVGLVRGVRSVAAWRFVLYSLGITNGDMPH